MSQKKFFGFTCVLMLVFFVVFVSSGCGGGGRSNSFRQNTTHDSPDISPSPTPDPNPHSSGYTVTFDTDGGSEIASINVASGSTIEMPVQPTKEGYIFIAWYKDKNFNEAFKFGENGDKITGNITLYALWLKDNPDIFNAGYAVSNASIGYVKGDNSNHVTNDLTLTTEVNGIAIRWSSSNASVISISSSKGRVFRPTEDTNVTLTANASSGSETKTREFNLTVIKAHTRISADIEDNTLSDIEAMNISNNDFRIAYKASSDIVTDLEGKYSDILIKNADDALDSVQNVRSILGIDNPYDELEAKAIASDSYSSEYSFRQVHKGVRVFGRGVTVSSKASGETNFLRSNFLSSKVLDNANLNKTLTAEQAEESVLNAVSEYDSIGIFSVVSRDTEMIIYSLESYDISPVYTYIVHVCGTDSSDRQIDGSIFIDASTGEIIDSMTNLHTNTIQLDAEDELGDTHKITLDVETDDNGNKTFVMYDPDSHMVVCRDEDIVTEENSIKVKHSLGYTSSSVSAYVNMRDILQWWRSDWFNRNSLKGNGELVIVTTGATGDILDNARWNGNYIRIGAKSLFGGQTHSGAVALDVLTHETTHAVMQYTIAGEFPYYNATGAINEGYADIFGCIKNMNWLYGAKSYEGSDKYTCNRNIAEPNDPKAKYQGPEKIGGDRYVDYTKIFKNGYFKFYGIWDVNDHGGVHTNSFIISHAAYLMHESNPAISGGLTWEELAKVWYKSMSGGYNAASDFSDVRCYVVKAAKDMNLSANKIEIIEKAFDTVGITDKFNPEHTPSPAPALPGDIPVTAEYFPDDTFRAYVKQFDTNSDNVLSGAERSVVVKIDVSVHYSSDTPIKSLKGLEYFTELQYLDCSVNQLTSLDVTGCTALQFLHCYANQLTSLNLTGCTTLKELQCGHDQMTSLDITGCTALEVLACEYSSLTNLDITGCTALKDLRCGHNQLTSLNLTGCTTLQNLHCYDNQLTSLDLTGCTALQDLNCANTQLTSLNLTGCTALESLNCENNQLTNLDLTGFTALYYLHCYDNQLTNLNLTGFTALESLVCDNNQLTSLNLTGCSALLWLVCDNNQLTSLNLTGCTALESLNCENNQLTNLDLTGFTALYYLHCDYNQLTNLDITGCTALKDMWCDYNQLTNLDLTGFTALQELYCYHNQLTSLNLTGCTALWYLACEINQLTNLNLTGCTALYGLNCNNNQLTSLNLTDCSALQALGCENNQLTTLDLRPCPNIRSVHCDGNVNIIYSDSSMQAATTTHQSGGTSKQSVIVASLPEFYADRTGTYTFSVSLDHEIPSGAALTLEGASGSYSFTGMNGSSLDLTAEDSINRVNLAAYFIEGRTYSPVIVAEYDGKSNSGGCNINAFGVMILAVGIMYVGTGRTRRIKRL
ncbi:MAG: M4 family metallopeptidase [Synergistaceae bacterium]|nr:M4 family metallopeptidase [Synergistaceae bacterium]